MSLVIQAKSNSEWIYTYTYGIGNAAPGGKIKYKFLCNYKQVVGYFNQEAYRKNSSLVVSKDFPDTSNIEIESAYNDLYDVAGVRIKLEGGKLMVFDIYPTYEFGGGSSYISFLKVISPGDYSLKSAQGLFKSNCLQVIIKASVDLLGEDLSEAVLTSDQGCSLRKVMYFGKYVIGKKCEGLISKIVEISNKYYTPQEVFDVLNGISLYGLTKYYLWYLLTKAWDFNILRRRYNKYFLDILSKSKYSCWVNIFLQPEQVKLSELFIY